MDGNGAGAMSFFCEPLASTLDDGSVGSDGPVRFARAWKHGSAMEGVVRPVWQNVRAAQIGDVLGRYAFSMRVPSVGNGPVLLP